MSIELRLLTPEDSRAHHILMNHAFSQGQVVPAETAEARDLQNTWGIFEGTNLCADLTIEPYAVHWGETAVLKMGGLAGVATFAHERGRGYVDKLLHHSLEIMRQRGEVISALYPFAWAFYRRYGWDWVGEKRDVMLPLRELRSHPLGKEIAAIEGEMVRAELSPIYTAFARQYRGVFTENSHRWERILEHSDNRTTHVYTYPAADANVEGYLLWRYGTGGDNSSIREFVANTPNAHHALLSLLHYFATQADRAHLTVPADSVIWSFLMHWNMETRVRPVFMGRVVDVEKAFTQLPLNTNLPNSHMTLHVRDEQAPWNNGLWRITAEDGTIHCQTVAAAVEAEVTLDIQALSQAFWGTPSLVSLRRAGRVEVGAESGYDLLSQILPPAPVYTMDGF